MGESASSKTDLYALGCIIFALVQGHPPFKGPGKDAYRKQHLIDPPASLNSGNVRLDTLVSMLLRKDPMVRPSRERTLASLVNIRKEGEQVNAKGESRLHQIGRSEAARAAEQEAEQKQLKREAEQRTALAKFAIQELQAVGGSLVQEILDAVPTAIRISAADHISIGTDRARVLLRIPDPAPLPLEPFANVGWDVVVYGVISVDQVEPHYRWSSSIFFMRLNTDSDYRWFELSFFRAFGSAAFEPFSLDPGDARSAVARGLHSFQVAFGPKAIDGEDVPSFVHRWADLFARAHEGKLEHPRYLPL
jgi:serine/threonine-protein kinase